MVLPWGISWPNLRSGMHGRDARAYIVFSKPDGRARRSRLHLFSPITWTGETPARLHLFHMDGRDACAYLLSRLPSCAQIMVEFPLRPSCARSRLSPHERKIRDPPGTKYTGEKLRYFSPKPGQPVAGGGSPRPGRGRNGRADRRGPENAR